jgi:hypothetical protein
LRNEYLDKVLPGAAFGFERAGLFMYRTPQTKALVLPAEAHDWAEKPHLRAAAADVRFITFDDAVAVAVPNASLTAVALELPNGS